VKANRASDLAERLEELTLPVLVITGDDDRIVPTADSIPLSRTLPNAQLVLIANAGHVAPEERPVYFMEVFHNLMMLHS
jgi:pimeloyl-ACP methyl ester carboxylesterase